MLASLQSSTLAGIEAIQVDIEVRVARGEPRFTVIGLGDNAIKESRERIVSALTHSGFEVPDQLLVNLAPAEVKKEGSAFDLPIALGILIASGQLASRLFGRKVFVGELALDGRLKPVRGVLARSLAAHESGAREMVVPVGNGAEAALVAGMKIHEVSDLLEVVQCLKEGSLKPFIAEQSQQRPGRQPTLSEIVGQSIGKRAAVVAAAGGHNLLLIGPPGCGKSMLAERFVGLLPPLQLAQQLEAIKVHGAAGLPIDALLSGHRPYRAPHHVVSDVGLVGGGAIPRPGEVSLAHHGVLFLDEFPEFRRSALEALRAPLEVGAVRITRAQGSLHLPARFQLIAAMNPCPCGRQGLRGAQCLCSRTAVGNYLRKLSQPILDRIDLHVELDGVPLRALTEQVHSDHAEDQALADSVAAAHDRQVHRQGHLNRQLSSIQIRELNLMTPGAQRLLEVIADRGELSARGFVRVLRVAHTIADLDRSDAVSERHLAEALSYRSLERLSAYAQLSG